tara:strand:+ start:1047 stop:1199 length:153 start_codon:yes stop_codon:yes gene_type:complete
MWDYSISQWVTSDGQTEPYGVVLQIDNGDTQYLTIEDYTLFLKNREKIRK